MLTCLVDDLDERVAEIATRGIEPATREVYENGACTTIYRDPDGIEIGFGDAPESELPHLA